MLLSPLQPQQVKEVLRTARSETTKQNVKEILEEKLSIDEIVDNISEVLRDSTQGATRLRAAYLGCKLHGVLNNDDNKVIPVINVYINGAVDSINPILFPRESS
jgi:hypothetical protein